jgi:hypothetical protein
MFVRVDARLPEAVTFQVLSFRISSGPYQEILYNSGKACQEQISLAPRASVFEEVL